MAWSISHGGSKNSTFSGTQIGELGEKLQRTARPGDWAALVPIFAHRSGDPFKIPPQQAEQIGQALLQAADSLKIWDPGWAKKMARQIGESALLAARLGEPWRWS